MSKKADDFHRSVRDALRNAPAVWTPHCPEPETLLDWVEQGEAHPQAAVLLDHLLGCAYCRHEHATLGEVRGLAPIPAAPRDAPRRDGRLAAWVAEVIQQGFVRPTGATRTALETLDRLSLTARLAPARGAETPRNLRPAWTAIRASRPILRWSGGDAATEFTVVLMRHTGRKAQQRLWEGSAGPGRRLAVPELAGLEPGGLYLWQVIAREAGEEAVSPSVCFAVLADTARRQLETLEMQTRPETPERIALLEAFGLYDEALQQADAMVGLRPDDAMSAAIRAKLLERQPE